MRLFTLFRIVQEALNSYVAEPDGCEGVVQVVHLRQRASAAAVAWLV